MGRKNWLFANTPGGAQASSVIYSLIETAKENDLDPYRYLLRVLQNAPQLRETNKAWAESRLPANAPDLSPILCKHCRAVQNRAKFFKAGAAPAAAALSTK